MGGGLPGVGYPNLGLDAGMQGQMGQYAGMPTVMMANVGGVMQPVVVMPQVGMQVRVRLRLRIRLRVRVRVRALT